MFDMKEFQDLKEKIMVLTNQENPSTLPDKNILYKELILFQKELVNKNIELLDHVAENPNEMQVYSTYIQCITQIKENWFLVERISRKIQEIYREYNHDRLPKEVSYDNE